MDDDPPKQGAVNWRAQGVGVDEALPTLVPALGIEQVIITIADAPQVRLRRILSIYERITARARAQMIPAMYDLLPELRPGRAKDNPPGHPPIRTYPVRPPRYPPWPWMLTNP